MNEHDQLPESLRKLRPKGDGFRRPDDAYLRQMTDRVLHSSQEKVQPKASARVRRLPSWVAGIAATLLLLLWFQPWNTSPIADTATEPTTTSAAWEQTLANVSDDDLLAYIQENIEEFELETLVTANE